HSGVRADGVFPVRLVEGLWRRRRRDDAPPRRAAVFQRARRYPFLLSVPRRVGLLVRAARGHRTIAIRLCALGPAPERAPHGGDRRRALSLSAPPPRLCARAP